MTTDVRRSIRGRFLTLDLFTRCFLISALVHSCGFAAYALALYSSQNSAVNSQSLRYEDVDVDFSEMPPELIGGDRDPAATEKDEWIEGLSRKMKDREQGNANPNLVSGTGTDKDGYLFSFHGDKPPTPIFNFDLEKYFPIKAKEAKITESIVKVKVQVDEMGSLDSVRVLSVQHSGYGFEESALQLIKRARFSPGYKKGKPVRMVHEMAVRFVLKQ